MKTDPNDLIIPVQATEFAPGHQDGLTKREYFAAVAMQGLQSKPFIYVASDCNHEAAFDALRKEAAKRSVQLADALIEELNK